MDILTKVFLFNALKCSENILIYKNISVKNSESTLVYVGSWHFL